MFFFVEKPNTRYRSGRSFQNDFTWLGMASRPARLRSIRRPGGGARAAHRSLYPWRGVNRLTIGGGLTASCRESQALPIETRRLGA
jgi:hypothetical protein